MCVTFQHGGTRLLQVTTTSFTQYFTPGMYAALSCFGSGAAMTSPHRFRESPPSVDSTGFRPAAMALAFAAAMAIARESAGAAAALVDAGAATENRDGAATAALGAAVGVCVGAAVGVTAAAVGAVDDHRDGAPLPLPLPAAVATTGGTAPPLPTAALGAANTALGGGGCCGGGGPLDEDTKPDSAGRRGWLH